MLVSSVASFCRLRNPARGRAPLGRLLPAVGRGRGGEVHLGRGDGHLRCRLLSPPPLAVLGPRRVPGRVRRYRCRGNRRVGLCSRDGRGASALRRPAEARRVQRAAPGDDDLLRLDLLRNARGGGRAGTRRDAQAAQVQADEQLRPAGAAAQARQLLRRLRARRDQARGRGLQRVGARLHRPLRPLLPRLGPRRHRARQEGGHGRRRQHPTRLARGLARHRRMPPRHARHVCRPRRRPRPPRPDAGDLGDVAAAAPLRARRGARCPGRFGRLVAAPDQHAHAANLLRRGGPRPPPARPGARRADRGRARLGPPQGA
mmetsp:Transcript_41142/g.133867  ORF Transcript_41142/g.133867 Transcript_41142/m.133867 type:complete len:316 (-) Transcript_41142:211-1158(-)